MVEPLLKDRELLSEFQEELRTLDPSPKGKDEWECPPPSQADEPGRHKVDWGIPPDFMYPDRPDDRAERSFNQTVRRLIAVPDKEGKTRVVACLDYWSQTVLRPIHIFLAKFLRAIPQDMTFNQGGFIPRVLSWGDCTYYSVDLTQATDRFPAYVVGKVLEPRFGPVWVEHWLNILIGYGYSSPKGTASYSVGLPMGSYSSWVAFTLAHHYIFFWCCRELKID